MITLIYPDTNIWNKLLDQNVDPQKLLSSLAAKNASLLLSGQTIYELSRTFASSSLTAAARAQQLFLYLKDYVDAEIPCAHDNMEQLCGEVKALNTGADQVVAFFGPAEYASLRAEVEKLSRGSCDARVEHFIAGRQRFSASTRSAQKDYFQGKSTLREHLKSIPEAELRGWLDAETLSDRGSAILAGHLLRAYTGLSPQLAMQNAHALLHIAQSRISKAIVRADLYYNWRCANRGSNRKDLVDDLYHVLNASYSSIYVTAEPGQAEYASLILSQWTRVEIYEGDTPVDAWLLGLV